PSQSSVDWRNSEGGRSAARRSRIGLMPGPSGSRYIGVSGASGGRGGSDAVTTLPSAAIQEVWLASAKSWSSPASQNTGTTGRDHWASSTRASAAAESAL